MNNTGGNLSFSVAKAIGMNAYPPCGTENFGVRSPGKSNHGCDRVKGKGPHSLLPMPIISSNPLANNIEGEREKEGTC